MKPAPFRPPERATVLLVDDEPDILVALGDLLEDEYQVLSTTSPVRALELLAEHAEIAVIVSDQRMPGMTGDAFLARARDMTQAEALLLTGYADLSAVVAALNDGRISGYAHKPWEPVALVTMIRQAAERARLGAALRDERMLLSGLMDSIDDGLSFKDREGRFIRLNGVAAGRLGHGVDDCLGRTEQALLEGLAAEDERRAIENEDERALGPDGGPSRVLSRIERNRRACWMERLRGPLRDADGVVQALATFERDVTVARLMEDRLRQADRMQALGTMAGGVAHDFNNLLTAVLGSLELAQRAAGEDARLLRLIETAIAGAERGAALTQRLLSFSRQRDTVREVVDVNALVQAMDDLLARSINQSQVRIVQRLQPDLPVALVDPAQLELALLNLCINARDAMDGAGTITLSTRWMPEGEEDDHVLRIGTPPAGGSIAVGVSDTGSGMEEEVAARIFEPFYTTKEIGRGTGLGLSMVYGFVQQSGGAVWVRTAPGAGTSFRLCLPTTPATASG